MYSNKENVNTLTALLVAHGIRHAVCCPGSRNAPIVHNLNECPDICCYAVTDERSAAFYALGMVQALDRPVCVCVTSGTALLNLLPAVAEAWYQHMPLVVVSADRPPQWIGQLDGQTLPQPGALEPFVAKSVTLSETDHWQCNRAVNEALIAATGNDARPVHINVPLTEPLFGFSTPALPAERVIRCIRPAADYSVLHTALFDELIAAERPMIVFGQTNPHRFDEDGVDWLFSHVIVLHEATSKFPSVSHFDEVLASMPADEDISQMLPDFIIYVGGNIVSKRLRHFLRRAKDAITWRISPTPDVEDTFMNLRGIVVGDADFVLQSIDEKMRLYKTGLRYRRQWLHALTDAANRAAAYEPPYSQMAAVRLFEQTAAEEREDGDTFHYANSSAIRLANIYAAHHVWCNRGVSGIEGTLSTAAGFSLVSHNRVFCVIGDLSFFYDQNALWNSHLRGNLRILLLNNHRGGIFSMVSGISQSPAHDRLIEAAHHASAEGICRQNGVEYLQATNTAEMQRAVTRLFSHDGDRPILAEIVTDASDDERALKAYLQP